MLINSINMDPLNRNQKLRTATGIKDTFLHYFIEKLEKIKRVSSSSQNQEQRLQAELERMPLKPFSAVWRLKGISLYSLVKIVYNLL